MAFKRTVVPGFSLIELMVAMSVFAIIMTLSIPGISGWIGKAKVRASAEALQNSIRFAQSEAAKRNRLVEFSLVDSTAPPAANSPAADNGRAWIVRVVPSPGSREAPLVLQADVFPQEGVRLTGGDNKTLVFGGVGQTYTSIPDASNPDPALSWTRAYRIASSNDKHVLCVLVRPGGGVRWCDPAMASGDRACPSSSNFNC